MLSSCVINFKKNVLSSRLVVQNKHLCTTYLYNINISSISINIYKIILHLNNIVIILNVDLFVETL